MSENVEFKIHVAIFDHVKTKKAFNCFICHIWQGRDAKDGFFLKMMGVIAGVADFLVLWRGRCCCGAAKIGIGFLEVKKPHGIQSSAQKKFQGICNWLGVPYAIVRTVAEAHSTLLSWGCPENHHAIKEPDTRTLSQKFTDSREFYRL